MADDNSPLRQKIFNIAQAQAETGIQPDSMFDDFRWKTMASKAGEILAFGHGRHLSLGGWAVKLTVPTIPIRHNRSPLWIIANPPWHIDAVGGGYIIKARIRTNGQIKLQAGSFNPSLSDHANMPRFFRGCLDSAANLFRKTGPLQLA